MVVIKKVCPFDKRECVGESCMLFSETIQACSFLNFVKGDPKMGSTVASHGLQVKEQEKSTKKQARFKAELFD